MRCRKARKKISALLDGETGEREKERITSHLRACKTCEEELETLSSLSLLLKAGQESINPSPYFWNKLEQRIVQAEESKSVFGNLWEKLNHVFIPATATVVLLIGLYIGIQLGDFVYSSIDKILNPERVTLVQQEVDQSLHLDTLDDFPRESIGQIYTALLAENNLSE